MSEDMVHRALAAFNAGDAAAFAELFTEDGIMIDYPDKVAGAGRAQIQAYLGPLFAAFPKARVTLQGRIDLGARQITHERFDRGPLRHTRSARGILGACLVWYPGAYHSSGEFAAARRTAAPAQDPPDQPRRAWLLTGV